MALNDFRRGQIWNVIQTVLRYRPAHYVREKYILENCHVNRYRLYSTNCVTTKVYSRRESVLIINLRIIRKFFILRNYVVRLTTGP